MTIHIGNLRSERFLRKNADLFQLRKDVKKTLDEILPKSSFREVIHYSSDEKKLQPTDSNYFTVLKHILAMRELGYAKMLDCSDGGPYLSFEEKRTFDCAAFYLATSEIVISQGFWSNEKLASALYKVLKPYTQKAPK
jgi:hypothetical protein